MRALNTDFHNRYEIPCKYNLANPIELNVGQTFSWTSDNIILLKFDYLETVKDLYAFEICVCIKCSDIPMQ